MLKVELHAHTSDDPCDPIPHSSHELIDRAAALGYHALAITLHDRQLDVAPFGPYARSKGIVLIPGVERTIGGKHLLLINFPPEAESVNSFGDLQQLKRKSTGLVVVPHAFYPTGSCMRGSLDGFAPLVDAVEVNALYTSTLNFNKSAIRWAAEHHKPLVGNGDVHHLSQLGTTFSLVDAEPSPDAICEAIRAGRVEVRTSALSWRRALAVAGHMFLGELIRWRRPTKNGGVRL